MEGGWRPFLWSHPTSDGRILQNVNDLNQWLSALRKASAPNPDKPAACHSGAFRSSRWTCCLQADRSGEGAGRAEAPPSLSISGCSISAWAGCANLGKLPNFSCLSLVKCEMGLIIVPASWGCKD